MTATEETSLQRLLALDKTYNAFDDRIDAVTNILNISLDDTTVVTHKTGSYARFDFTLRWILDKLAKDAMVRSNPLAWALLHRVLTALPEAIASKSLVKSELTAVVVKTLEEHFSGFDDSAATVANSEPAKTSKSKKRKRSEAVDTTADGTSQLNGVFSQLSKIIRAITLPSMHQHIVPFTRLWTHALINISGDAIGYTSSELERLLTTETEVLISLWTKNARSMTRTDAEAVFAKEIAWPVSIFASQCSSLGVNEPAILIRKLLSKMFLKPSHDAYIKESLSGIHTQISKDAVHSIFTPMAESVYQFMDVEGDMLQTREKTVTTILATLFDEIASLKQHLSPREKRYHNRWTESVFLELSSAIEKLRAKGGSLKLRKRLIQTILNHVSNDGQVLGNTILENIIVSYTGLTHPLPSTEDAIIPDFALIAQIIHLGPTIFHEGQQNPLLSLRGLLDSINFFSSQEVVLQEKEWVRTIVVPLINAQTQSQRAEKFFQLWSDAFSAYDLAGAGPRRVWQDPEVRTALARLLQMNLDVNHARQILDRAATDFGCSIAKKSRDSEQKPLSIDTALLQIAVVVDIIRSDGTIDALREDFERLLESLVETFPKLGKETPKTHFWESVLRLHQHVAPDSDDTSDTAFLTKAVQIQALCVEDAASVVLKAIKKKTELTADVLAALSYLLQTYTFGKELGINAQHEAPSLGKLLTRYEKELVDENCKKGISAVAPLLFAGRLSNSELVPETEPEVNGSREKDAELTLEGIPEIVLEGCNQPPSQAKMLSILELIKTCSDPRVFNACMQTLKPVVRDRDFKLSQFAIESLLSALHTTLSPTSSLNAPSKARFIYTDICILLRSILQFYRPSLGGRLHILLPLLRQLLSCLFDPSTIPAGARSTFQHPPWLTTPLRVQQAQLFARLVTMLCNPAPSTLPHHRKGGRAALTDPVRAARLHVAEFAPSLLGAFVRFRLQSAGGMASEVREALTPAVDALFDVMDMAEEGDGRVLALSAGMDRREVALLETEHGGWKRRGRWRGA